MSIVDMNTRIGPWEELMLSDEEVNAILEGMGLTSAPVSKMNSEKDLQDYLVKLSEKVPDPPASMFSKEAHTLSFFGDENSGAMLDEVKKKNLENGVKPITVAGVTLVNYSYCPECGKVYSWPDLHAYYNKPHVPDGCTKGFAARKDTRVLCECGTFFMPSLIIEDSRPKSEVQYLCRVQWFDAVELYIDRPVLTRNKENMLIDGRSGKLLGVKQDIVMGDIETSPHLVANMLQYTPYDQTLRMLSGDYNNMLALGGREGNH